jgi:CheY-like chemotaxis protein
MVIQVVVIRIPPDKITPFEAEFIGKGNRSGQAAGTVGKPCTTLFVVIVFEGVHIHTGTCGVWVRVVWGMDVLILDNSPDLGGLWQMHLIGLGMAAALVGSDDEALAYMRGIRPDVILANLDLPGSGAIIVADYAAYRYPDTRVVFVTASSHFSDGSIFSTSPNACAFLPARTPPEDLAAVVEFHAHRKTAAS